MQFKFCTPTFRIILLKLLGYVLIEVTSNLNRLRKKKLDNAKTDAERRLYDETIRQVERDRIEFKEYMEKGAELSVDPMWLYLMNPKLAKDLMPLNSKMIREEFRKANGTIQFYSHPLATILAVVMSMGMLQALGLEEPDEEVMPDGIPTAKRPFGAFSHKETYTSAPKNPRKKAPRKTQELNMARKEAELPRN